MIFDDTIEKPEDKANYHAQLEGFAAVLHNANKLVMDVFDIIKNLPNQTAQQNHVASLLLARHVIEMTDGIEVLVAKGCAEPCKALLRSSLEAAMGALYIMEADSDRRNMAYQVAHAHKRIKLYLKYDKNTPQGKTFDCEMAGDMFWQTAKPKYDFPKMIATLESMFKRPEFSPIEAEWQAMKRPGPKTCTISGCPKKRKKKDDPQWYALFGGPTNVRELAKELHMRGEYEFLYRHWSETIHAGGVMTQIKGVNIGGKQMTIILPLRNPEHLQVCVMIAVTLCLKIGHAIVRKYAPAELKAFAEKYVDKVQKPFMTLTNGGQFITMPWKTT